MQIEKSYRLPFARQRVFTAWVSSETVVAPAIRMFVEPWVGGAYHLFMDNTDAPSMAGTFLEVSEHQSLRYTWEWFGDGHVSEVAVQFTDDGEGTLILLSHGGFHSVESYQAHDLGWDSYVRGVTNILKRQAPK